MKPTGMPRPTIGKPKPKQHYYMCAVKVMYEKNELINDWLLNILLESPNQSINRTQLAQINASVMQRLKSTHDVSPNDVVDIVVLNVFHLGHMAAKEFFGEAQDTPNAN